MKLNSYNSINSSRSFKDRDIVHLAFTVFHELTHQKQKLDAREDGNFDGAAKEINWILGKEDYHRNYDTDETEIDADERSWMRTSSFVARFLGKQKELWVKCQCQWGRRRLTTFKGCQSSPSPLTQLAG